MVSVVSGTVEMINSILCGAVCLFQYFTILNFYIWKFPGYNKNDRRDLKAVLRRKYKFRIRFGGTNSAAKSVRAENSEFVSKIQNQ